MSPRSRDLSFLLGLAIGGCGSAVDDPNGGTGDDGNLLDAAIEACTPWAKQYAECYNEQYANEDYSLSYVAFVGYCISYFGYAQVIGPACVDAVAEYHACIAALDCEELFDDGDDESYPCEAEAEAREQACDLEVESDSEDIPVTDAGEFGDETTTDDGDSTTIGEPPATSTTQTTSASDSSSSDDGGSESTTG